MSTKQPAPAKKRWSDFTPVQQRVMVIGAVIQLTLFAAANVDIARRRPEELRGPKWLWRMLTLVNFIGPLAYFAFGRKRIAPYQPPEAVADVAA